MAESFSIHAFLPASPAALYEAFLDPALHAAMTGSPARGEGRVGRSFEAWEGYISGKHLTLEEDARIVQSWRTTEFPVDAPDSTLELVFEGSDSETRLTINHSGLPDGTSAAYREGWREYYFEPMRRYFETVHDGAIDEAPAKKKAAVKKKPVAKKKPVTKRKAVAKKKPVTKQKAVVKQKAAVKKPAAKKRR